jgi:hypothetical protein
VVVATIGRLPDAKTVAYDVKTLKPIRGLSMVMADPSIKRLASRRTGGARQRGRG